MKNITFFCDYFFDLDIHEYFFIYFRSCSTRLGSLKFILTLSLWFKCVFNAKLRHTTFKIYGLVMMGLEASGTLLCTNYVSWRCRDFLAWNRIEEVKLSYVVSEITVIFFKQQQLFSLRNCCLKFCSSCAYTYLERKTILMKKRGKNNGNCKKKV